MPMRNWIANEQASHLRRRIAVGRVAVEGSGIWRDSPPGMHKTRTNNIK